MKLRVQSSNTNRVPRVDGSGNMGQIWKQNDLSSTNEIEVKENGMYIYTCFHVLHI